MQRNDSLSVDEILNLPAAVDVPTAARALGIGRCVAFELIHTGEFPATALRLGKRLVVTRSSLLGVLGIEDRPPVTQAA